MRSARQSNALRNSEWNSKLCEGPREHGLNVPPRAWMDERLTRLQQLLEKRTERSGLLLRKLLGTVVMCPVTPEVGRPYYRAMSALDVLPILDEDSSPTRDAGSN